MNKNNDEVACKPVHQSMKSICPNEWYTKWDEERDEGTFSKTIHYCFHNIIHKSDIHFLFFTAGVKSS